MKPEYLLLAAGRSTRMGEPKGLKKIGAQTFIEWQLARIQAAGFTPRVVIGVEVPAYREFIKGISFFENPDPQSSPYESLRLGMGQGPLFVQPIDVPVPSQALLQALAQALQAGVQAVLPSDGKRAGHPVLLAAEFLKSLPQVGRLDEQIRALRPEQKVYVTTAEELPFLNLNDPAAFQSFVEKSSHLHHTPPTSIL